MTSVSNIMNRGLTLSNVAEGLGVVLGLLIVSAASILIGAWIIQWILSACGIITLTYSQAVGALAVWEIIKPRSSSK